jgi:hypothetical protein
VELSVIGTNAVGVITLGIIGLVLGAQFISMIFHRIGTFLILMANIPLFSDSIAARGSLPVPRIAQAVAEVPSPYFKETIHFKQNQYIQHVKRAVQGY